MLHPPRALSMGDSDYEMRLGTDLTEIFTELIQPNYILWSGSCLLYYDYLLTLSSEVEIIWRSKWSLSTIFYTWIRYETFLVATLGLLHNFRLTPKSGPQQTVASCEGLSYVLIVLNTFNYLMISAFVAVRIAALWNRNWRLGVLLFVFGLINPACLTQIFAVFGAVSVPGPWPLASCISFIDISNPMVSLAMNHLPLVTSGINIVYELLCLLLTVYKTFHVCRELRQTGMPTSLTELLLRNGTLYFVVMSAFALYTIVSSSLPIGAVPTDIQHNVLLTYTLTPILTTRFIADLKAFERGPNVSSTYSEDSENIYVQVVHLNMSSSGGHSDGSGLDTAETQHSSAGARVESHASRTASSCNHIDA